MEREGGVMLPRDYYECLYCRSHKDTLKEMQEHWEKWHNDKPAVCYHCQDKVVIMQMKEE